MAAGRRSGVGELGRLPALPEPGLQLRRPFGVILDLYWPSDGVPHLLQSAPNLDSPIPWQTEERFDEAGRLYRRSVDPRLPESGPARFYRVVPEP